MSYPKRGISVDIGNDNIKIAEYIRNKNKLKIKNTLIVKTPENSMSDGQITDVTVMSEAIRGALREAKIKNKNVLFTVSSSKVITREVDLPDLPTKKLDTLIKLNAEEYFPVNLAEYTLDYSVVEKIEAAEPKVKVNIIAALTTLVESYVELASELKLKIAGIDYSGNSIVNFAKHIDEDRTYMLLDLGSDSTMVTIMNQGVVRFNRNLVYGTKVISNSIQNHFGVGYDEAMKISTEQSLLTHSPEGNDYLSSDVSSALNQILNGVSRLVDYYISRNKDGIDRIIIVGGGTSIIGIDDYIENYFNIKTKVLESTDITVITGDESFEAQKVFFANALGAVYSEINLLPLSLTGKSTDKAANRLRLEIGLLVVLLGAVAIYLPYSSLQSLKVERDELVAEIEQKSVVQPVLNQYNEVMQELSFYNGLVSSSNSTTEVVKELLEEFERTIPTEIDFLTLNNTEEGIAIACVASEKLDVVQFISVLKELELDGNQVFSRVHVPAVTGVLAEGSEDEVEYLTFSVLCEYNKGVE